MTIQLDHAIVPSRRSMPLTLADADGGTNLLAVHDGLPPGVPSADNETGWRMALAKLAAFVEAGG